MPEGPEKLWWRDAVVYQIYPASFKDSNGDGLGDIPGILSKIDHLRDLGIDVIWLSPMFASPQVDMGYDISNYEEVYPPYGTVKDMDDLIEACDKRGMKIILDLVINHTSDQHAWFKESRSSRDSPKRDWYIWKPPRYAEDGTRLPPNNWRSYFSGSTWEYDETTDEYYLHLFAKEQPDLNWENEEMRAAVYDSAMRFWLEKGIHGFRLDCINLLSKGIKYQSAPITDALSPEQPAWMIYSNGPRMHEFLREMNKKVLDNYDTMTVGELPHTPDPADVLKYVGLGDKQLNMVFQFDIVDIGQGSSHKYLYQDWKLPLLKKVITKWQQFIEGTDGWTTAFCENHDQGRSVSRYGSDAPEHRSRSAKLLAMLMCTLTGTLFIYQGQEIGMVNMPEYWPIEELKDIEALNFYRSMAELSGNDPATMDHVKRGIQILGRDNARLPMQWDSSAFSGFTEAEGGGWMRTHELYPEINVVKQEAEPDSVLNFWKSMIKFRKRYADALTYGAFEIFEIENEHTFVFAKRARGMDGKVVVALNFSPEDQTVSLPYEELLIKMANYDDAAEIEATPGGSTRIFRPWEGRLYVENREG